MDIQKLRILSSIPTHIIKDSESFPCNCGSGCFIRYMDRFNLFITVYHTVSDDDSTTNIISDFDENEGIKLLPLLKNSCTHMLESNLNSTKTEDVDFAFYKLDQIPNCYLLELDETGIVQTRIERITLPITKFDNPISTEEYGFAGLVYLSRGSTPFVKARFQDISKQELVYYDGLKYLESFGNYHVFSLPNNDYESGDFEGTSGAPILDSKGNLVALVASGSLLDDGTEWRIKGLNLNKASFF